MTTNDQIDMSHLDTSGCRRFGYSSSTAKAVMMLIIIAPCTPFGVLMIIQGKIAGGIFITLIGIIGLLGTLNMFFAASAVLIDDEGISRVLFRWQWKRIPWKDVRKVRIIRVPNFELFQPGQIVSASVDQTDKLRALFRATFFKLQPGDYASLVETLNFYIAKYRIPLFLQKNKDLIPLDRIDLAQLQSNR